MGAHGGRRAAPRRAAGSPAERLRSWGPRLGLSAGVTVLLVAWGYLVVLAVRLGDRVRDGSGAAAWLLLALTTLGAVACLFLCLLLGTRLWRTLAGASPPPPSGTGSDGGSDDGAPPPPRPPGGRRAAR